jgi:phosphoribosyl-ATP pyrophosphohydrolase/phosphoribosyl-AMP cyclohydrolase
MIDVEILKLDFQKLGGILPAIIQDSQTKTVLMLGFMNEQALEETLKRQKVVFWSRSKQRLWQKGEESGNALNVVSISADCDNDTLLVSVTPSGPTCHQGTVSCFDTSNH